MGRLDDETHTATPRTKWRAQSEVDRACRYEPHSIDFQTVPWPHFLSVAEASPPQQRSAMLGSYDPCLIAEELQGWDVQMVVMEVRDEHRIDALRGSGHTDVAMNETTDSRPQ
jgi:hypothetical protein